MIAGRLLLALPLIVCCLSVMAASTKLSSYIDPAFKDKSYKSLIDIADNMNLNERQIVELMFVEKLAKFGIRGVRSIDHLPPTRQYTNDEIIDILIKSKAEGILYVNLTDRDVRSSYVPPTYSTDIELHEDMFGISGHSTTQQHGRYTVESPVVYYDVKLIDMKSGKIAWIGQGGTAGMGGIFASTK